MGKGERREPENHREWLMDIILRSGGPPDCADDYVLNEDVLCVSISLSAFYFFGGFGGEATISSPITVGDYCKLLERQFPDRFNPN
jgi:hypothetical protein